MKTHAKKLLLLVMDIILISLAIYIALVFRFDGKIPEQFLRIYKSTILFIAAIEIISYYFFF